MDEHGQGEPASGLGEPGPLVGGVTDLQHSVGQRPGTEIADVEFVLPGQHGMGKPKPQPCRPDRCRRFVVFPAVRVGPVQEPQGLPRQPLVGGGQGRPPVGMGGDGRGEPLEPEPVTGAVRRLPAPGPEHGPQAEEGVEQGAVDPGPAHQVGQAVERDAVPVRGDGEGRLAPVQVPGVGLFQGGQGQQQGTGQVRLLGGQAGAQGVEEVGVKCIAPG